MIFKVSNTVDAGHSLRAMSANVIARAIDSHDDSATSPARMRPAIEGVDGCGSPKPSTDVAFASADK